MASSELTLGVQSQTRHSPCQDQLWGKLADCLCSWASIWLRRCAWRVFFLYVERYLQGSGKEKWEENKAGTMNVTESVHLPSHTIRYWFRSSLIRELWSKNLKNIFSGKLLTGAVGAPVGHLWSPGEKMLIEPERALFLPLLSHRLWCFFGTLKTQELRAKNQCCDRDLPMGQGQGYQAGKTHMNLVLLWNLQEMLKGAWVLPSCKGT